MWIIHYDGVYDNVQTKIQYKSTRFISKLDLSNNLIILRCAAQQSIKLIPEPHGSFNTWLIWLPCTCTWMPCICAFIQRARLFDLFKVFVLKKKLSGSFADRGIFHVIQLSFDGRGALCAYYRSIDKYVKNVHNMALSSQLPL